MQIDLIEINGVSIAHITSDTILINTPQDALEIIAHCGYRRSLRDFIFESNKTGRVGFADTVSRTSDLLGKEGR